MSSWGAIYRRDAGATSFEGEAIDGPTFEPMDLAEESEEGDVLALQTEDTSDVFVYDHWKQGALLRGLSYTMDGGFSRVSGEPEPWETNAFSVRPALGQVPYVTLATIMEAVEKEFRLPYVG